jgi:hypothetical protein
MRLKLTSTKLSVISAIALMVGGSALSIMNYQNIFASTLVIAALICLWFSQKAHRSKLFLIGLCASITGILFAATLNLFPIFLKIRNTDPTSQPAANLVSYLSGATFFCGMILILMSGFILIGISCLRTASLPKASGVFFVLGGFVAFSPGPAGFMLALSGLSWLIAIFREKRQSEWSNIYDSLDD